MIPMQKGISYVGRFLSDLTDNFETLEDMKTSAPVNPERPVYYPGENMMRVRKESMEKGVLVDEGIWKSVVEM